MKTKPFYYWLALVTSLDGITLWLLYHFNHAQFGYFPLFGLLFFLIFCIIIFHLGRSSAMSSDRNRFTAVFMGMIFLKLFLTIVIVLAYDKLITKVYLHHIVTFLVSYLYFTIYEVYFMSKLARWKA